LIGIPVAIFGVWAPVYAPDLAFNEPRWLISFYMIGAILFLFAGAGLMARNYFSLKDPNERRRIRVVVTGFLLTITGVALRFAIVLAHQSPQQFQAYPTVTALPWLFIPFSVAMPVSLAYAILRHRVFDIRIMIRQGIQYAAARGVLLSVVPALAVLLALDLLLHGSQPLVEILRQRGWLYGASGVLALLLHSKRHSWLTALDRRFFRERYDAQRVLREVVEEIRAARDLEKAARRVVLQIEATLHSETVAVMLRQPGEAFFRTFACAAAPPPEIPADSKILGLVRLLAKPVEIPQTDRNWLKKQLPHDESQFLKQARIEWLFPILLRAEGAESILALGPKRSEEPYAREDQDLIQAIVAGLALLLERTPVADEPAAGFWECPQCGACYGSGVSRCTNDGMKLALLTLSESLAKRYKIARRLGQGGMGTVYEAHDTELDRSVAVKFIRTERLAGTDAVSRFKREARAAAALSHPNILTIFDYGADEGRNAYIVMELLRGHTLRKELQMHGRLQAKRAGEIMQGVCGAVAAAHRQLLIHRDLKPENIFLVNPGGAEVAKVLDFGLVKPLSTLEETATLSSTAPGMLMGTVRYMSPEQLSGRPPDVSWDLWALALVAYEILVGTYPFDEGHGGHLVHEILAARVISPRVRLQNAPAQWESFFDRALCRDSSLRPSSAAQFAAEFQEIVS
jgi:tRNA A-37 threonylcarbamoyl transferase component Bud32